MYKIVYSIYGKYTKGKRRPNILTAHLETQHKHVLWLEAKLILGFGTYRSYYKNPAPGLPHFVWFSCSLPMDWNAAFSFLVSKSFLPSFGQHTMPPPVLLAVEEDRPSPICSFLSGALIGSPASNTWPERGAKRRTKANCSHVFPPNLVQAFWQSRGSRQCKTLNGEGSAGTECSRPWEALGM